MFNKRMMTNVVTQIYQIVSLGIFTSSASLHVVNNVIIQHNNPTEQKYMFDTLFTRYIFNYYNIMNICRAGLVSVCWPLLSIIVNKPIDSIYKPLSMPITCTYNCDLKPIKIFDGYPNQKVDYFDNGLYLLQHETS